LLEVAAALDVADFVGHDACEPVAKAAVFSLVAPFAVVGGEGGEGFLDGIFGVGVVEAKSMGGGHEEGSITGVELVPGVVVGEIFEAFEKDGAGTGEHMGPAGVDGDIVASVREIHQIIAQKSKARPFRNAKVRSVVRGGEDSDVSRAAFGPSCPRRGAGCERIVEGAERAVEEQPGIGHDNGGEELMIGN